jgi:pyruvate/2-oxoglutarate dehydrogenase complex dihydrolipoamide acyltransferase (E2) component
MSRRATLPGADELFRRTSEPAAEEAAPAAAAPAPAAPAATAVALAPAPEVEAPAEPAASTSATRVRATPKKRGRGGDLRPTGREKHDEKITVYVSPEELVALEQAKLALRAQHGLAVDRGRIVREAVAVIVADLEAKGEDSILVRRLRGL